MEACNKDYYYDYYYHYLTKLWNTLSDIDTPFAIQIFKFVRNQKHAENLPGNINSGFNIHALSYHFALIDASTFMLSATMLH